ncbi:MAG: hypothetical protein DHS20C14_19440 [Phycisphaeraceae bacterium]|nr:MAG: hypothetical protein DHS20C14_19440 [Phycisphaeraceae bacterium]
MARRQRTKLTVPPADPDARVTAIRVVRTDPRRVTVYVDKAPAARIWADDIHRLDLREGAPWTEDLAERVADAHGACEAIRGALRMLAARGRTRCELVTRLRAKGHTEHHARAAADRLADQGYIDDAAVARHAAASIVARQPAGKRLVEAKLRARGVCQSDAQAAAAEALEGHDPKADATALARKHLRAMSPTLERDVVRRRIVGRLARRGFDTNVALAAVDAALADVDA